MTAPAPSPLSPAPSAALPPADAATAIEHARAAYEYARDYSGQREQFGRPINENQGIAFQLADMATRVAAARNGSIPARI